MERCQGGGLKYKEIRVSDVNFLMSIFYKQSHKDTQH